MFSYKSLKYKIISKLPILEAGSTKVFYCLKHKMEYSFNWFHIFQESSSPAILHVIFLEYKGQIDENDIYIFF